MHPKSLKVTFALEAETAEEAVVVLGERFLRSTKTGCRIVRQSTHFSLAELCKALIEDWKSGKIAYTKGEVTLVFSAGELDTEADLLVYSPEQGDRFLYSKRIASSTATSAQTVEPQVINTLSQHLQTVSAALAELAAHQRSVESRMQDLSERVADSQSAADVLAEVAPAVEISEIREAIAQALKAQTDQFKPVKIGEIQEAIAQSLKAQTTQLKPVDAGEIQEAIAQSLKAQTDQFKQQLQTALDAQATYFVKILSSQLTSTALHFSQRVDSLQNQLTELVAQVAELKTSGQAELPPPPQTEAEWLKRFKETWGTVGDYEQYSSSHREANAETPLYYIPDWIALCELEWACQLNPTLARLQTLIYGENGIGYEVADILQQFGCHVDPQTGERYYIYHQGGFDASEALWQFVNNPQYSWLPELKRLWQGLGDRQHEIFRLFGWEQEAIASLESISDRTYQDRQAYDPWTSQKKTRDTLSDYLTLLNLGPFTPITLESIKRAYKQAMKVAHPDAGGSKEQAQRVNEAYSAILSHYFPEAT
jgi:chemotaxis protein histidine kinase CheA